jgi:uncharacterized membrane protein (UPF0127 family)
MRISVSLRSAFLACAFVLLLAFTAAASACGDDDAPHAVAATTHEISLTDAGHTQKLNVELATTEPEREQGLMLRQSLGDDTGMLFLFPAESSVGFWMKGTYIALDIAYIDDSGHIAEIRHGKPLDETILTPAKPYHSTLEVAGGWFERHNMGVGTAVALPANLPRAQ